MARHIRHYPLQSYNFKPRRQILTVRSYIQIHLTPPLCGRCVPVCAHSPAVRHSGTGPASVSTGSTPKVNTIRNTTAHGGRGWEGRRDETRGRAGHDRRRGAETDAEAGRRDERSSGASRPLLKIASVSDLMRFVMIVGDSRRRNFELSGLKVRPGARAAGVGWAGAALVVCRARAGDRRGHCARAGSGTDARGFVHEFKSFSLAFFLGGPAVACGVPRLPPAARGPRTRGRQRHPRGTQPATTPTPQLTFKHKSVHTQNLLCRTRVAFGAPS